MPSTTKRINCFVLQHLIIKQKGRSRVLALRSNLLATIMYYTYIVAVKETDKNQMLLIFTNIILQLHSKHVRGSKTSNAKPTSARPSVCRVSKILCCKRYSRQGPFQQENNNKDY